MTTDAAKRSVLLVMTCSPAIESQVIDWLLSREDSAGFTSVAAHGHSRDYEHLSIAEQVLGRQRRQQIQLVMDEELCEAFVARLTSELADLDLHYWVIPVLAEGRLGARAVTQETQ